MAVRFTDAPDSFYIGARVDPKTHEVQPNSAVLVNPRNLTTHGVILGMTGSGKTGLGVTILEEAALDGVPQIIIDSKGDISDMLLAFPEMTGEYFRPWVNPENADDDQTLDNYAKEVAGQWREGLTEWGIEPERVQAYRRSAQFSIYTPGSHEGLPISILASFERPKETWEGNEEMLRERIARLVTALLGLIGIKAEPLEDPEHILLANIFEYNWRRGSTLSIERLIQHVQDPPFAKLGVLDVDAVISQGARTDLAKKLNNLIAAPNFQSWISGEAIDIPSLLFTEEGYPRVTIFYVAHLNESERQLIVTILLENLLSWMHTLSGSTRLRALVYVDEVFEMFPPYPNNPPTKEPLMRLLKQARAFGLGLLLATQNAKDIDYKGLSNAGMWFVGKLQTKNDRQRVLEGLAGIDKASTSLDIDRVDALIAGLKPREFVFHNIHAEETPILIKTRHTMSYLRGPLTKEQVNRLMASQREDETTPSRPRRPRSMVGTTPSSEMAGRLGRRITTRRTSAAPEAREPASAETPESAPAYSGERAASATTPTREAPITRGEAPPGFSPARPSLTSSTEQYFLPTDTPFERSVRGWERQTGRTTAQVGATARLLYVPALLAQATVRFTHNKTNTSEVLWYAFTLPELPRMAYVEWEDYQAEPFDPNSLELDAPGEAFYADIPPALAAGGGLTNLRDNLVEWMYNNLELPILHNTMLDIYQGIGESEDRFFAHVRDAAHDARDEELSSIAERYDGKFERLENRVERKISRLDSRKDELQAAETQQLAAGTESALRLLRGQLFDTISRIARVHRFTVGTREGVEVYEEDLANLMADLDELEATMEQDLQAAQQKWRDAVQKNESVPIRPNKKDITMVLYGIGWVPYWYAALNEDHIALPATSSGLAEAQGIAYQTL